MSVPVNPQQGSGEEKGDNYSPISLGDILQIRRVSDKPVKKCPYCGKPLYKVAVFVGDRMWGEPFVEDCTCEQAQKEKEKRLREFQQRQEEEVKRKMRKAKQRMIWQKWSVDSPRMRARYRLDRFIPSYQPEAYELIVEYAKHFPQHRKEGNGLILIGAVGTGKTHLAFGLATYLLEHTAYSVVFSPLSDLLNRFRGLYGDERYTGERREKVLAEVYNADLVILDDVGKERITDWSLEEFYNFINYRYNNMLPVVITTNLTLSELEAKYNEKEGWHGSAIVSRLIEMSQERITTLTGLDFRTLPKQQIQVSLNGQRKNKPK